ncbi:hypothetical protein ANCDUO_26426 [Ancylostoma duodenale]|uniref:Uncharacterized protein n=1 Tax=Ancylostoma duodenale TaxID=51022 RepID=A0A0C2F4V8_9BILA|nr:hypothetical protein ANCDUO_26426 [Ancylostoma duodenale]
MAIQLKFTLYRMWSKASYFTFSRERRSHSERRRANMWYWCSFRHFADCTKQGLFSS